MCEFTGWVEDALGSFESTPPPATFDSLQILCRGFIAEPENLPRHESIARAYRRWGAQLQASLLGEYALAVFDKREGTLLVTNDALGIVPLYYSHTSRGLAFGSHLDTLLRHTGIGDLDDEYLADYLASGVCLGERTPYRAVRRLLPGRTLLWSRSRLRVRRTWELARTGSLDLPSAAQYEEKCRELLRNAIRLAVRAAGPVWCELSGGLDSSTIVCVAAESGGRPIEAISIVYGRSREADETEWIRPVIQKTGVPWHALDGDETPPFSRVPADFRAEPGNYIDTPLMSGEYGQFLDSHGVRAVLSGLGGDQVFLGSHPLPVYLADHLRSLRIRRLVDGLMGWRVRAPARRSLAYWLMACAIRPTIRRFLGEHLWQAEGESEFSPWIRPEFARRYRLVDRQLPPRLLEWPSAGAQSFGEPVISACRLAGNRNHLARSFEFRHPLLYRPLVEFMYAVPWERKAGARMDRILQRRALRGILPEAIRTRVRKKGIDQTLYEGLRQYRIWVDLATDRSRLVERGMVDGPAWLEAVGLARFGRVHHSSQFMAALTLEVWFRRLEEFSKQISFGSSSKGRTES